MAQRVTPLVAGNWKMNLLRRDAVALACDLVTRLQTGSAPGCDLLVCPPAVMLHAVAEALAGSPVALGAQDCHTEVSGAHTGDISAAMLADAGCSHVIVGHSERRADHGEDDALVREKARAAHEQGMRAIICVGETLEQRDAGNTIQVVEAQLNGSLPLEAAAANTVIAYEPVWAIGTGRTPTAADVAEVHARIRDVLVKRLPDGETVRILYGGSVNPGNAPELMTVENVNGGLIGGASLKADDFWAIARACPG
ncbi:MAG: triose-phosphate isomerase [Alphaproteobacteria bacterium]|nr:triose-phosphate isomerase [Alphaproteobacteria bacterium]